eukprot:symbB.v1.2.038836.t1/scaffold6198.1/size20156/1
MVHIEASEFLVVAKSVTNARVRLVCFPHSGGGPSAFSTWPQYFEDALVELVLISAPGRERRVETPSITDMDTLVGNICEALQVSGLVDGVPYAFFGHSLGALVAYETARKLDADMIPGRPRPLHIFASGHGGPAPTPQSPFGSGSGARFRMPADYARRGINRGDALQAEPRDLLQEEITMATSEVATVQREFAEQFGEGRVDLQHAEDGSRDFTATTVEWFASADSFTTAGKAQEALCARWADVLQDDEQEEGHEQDILIIFTQWGRHILPSLTQDWQSGYAEAWGQKQLFMRWQKKGRIEKYVEDRKADRNITEAVIDKYTQFNSHILIVTVGMQGGSRPDFMEKALTPPLLQTGWWQTHGPCHPPIRRTP